MDNTKERRVDRLLPRNRDFHTGELWLPQVAIYGSVNAASRWDIPIKDSWSLITINL